MNILNIFKLSLTALAITTALGACSSSGGGGDGGGGDAAVEKSGKALADGYLQFATVCLDTTKNNSCDDEDVTVKTSSATDGSFTLSALASQYAQFAILAESKADGSTSDDSGAITADKKLVLSTPPGKTEPTTGDITVSPLTTIIQGYQQANLGLSAEAAEQQVKDNLGVESSAVSLFDDYVEQLKQLAQTTKPIATGAIATGALTNAQAYTLFNQVAQVTTATIQQAIADVVADSAAANSQAGLDLGVELDSLIAIIINDVVEALPQLVTAIAALPAGDGFNPVALVTSVGLTIDLTTLADAVNNQEQINTATATGMQAILEDGLNFFDTGSFFSEAIILTHERITLNPAGNALIRTKTAYDPASTVNSFEPVTNQGNNNSGFFLSTTGWAQEPADDLTGSSVTINADGGADIVTVVDSFSISGAVTDVTTQPVIDYAPIFLQQALTGNTARFSSGAKAIRFTGVSLSDSYYLNTNSFVPSKSGNGAQAAALNDIISSTAFDTTGSIAFIGQTLSCQAPSFVKCIDVEFIGSDTSGAIGSTGTAQYYVIDNAPFPSTVTALADTGTWSIETIRGETILKAVFPASIRNQLISFGDVQPGNGILFSLPSDNTINATLLRGSFDLAGDAFVDENWAFNDIAAADIEQVIISDFNSGSGTTVPTNALAFLAPPLPAITGLLNDGTGTFNATLFQEDNTTNTGIILAQPQPYTLGTALNLPPVGALIDLKFVFLTPSGIPEPEVQEVSVTSSIDTTTVAVTLTTYTDSTKTTTIFTEQGLIKTDTEGTLLLATLPGQSTGETTIARFIPIVQVTDPIGGINLVDTIMVFTAVDETTSTPIGQGVLTGSLPVVVLF